MWARSMCLSTKFVCCFRWLTRAFECRGAESVLPVSCAGVVFLGESRARAQPASVAAGEWCDATAGGVEEHAGSSLSMRAMCHSARPDYRGAFDRECKEARF